VTDAVVLLAIVLFAITAFPFSFLDQNFLFLSCVHCGLPIVVQTAHTLADTRYAAQSILQADAVQLTALPTLAVASFRGPFGGDRLFLRGGISLRESLCLVSRGETMRKSMLFLDGLRQQARLDWPYLAFCRLGYLDNLGIWVRVGRW